MKKGVIVATWLALCVLFVFGSSAFGPDPGPDDSLTGPDAGASGNLSSGRNAGTFTPDTSISFIAARFDTAAYGSSSDVYLLLKAAAYGQNGLAQWQWKQEHDGTWWPVTPDDWRSGPYTGNATDSTYARILTDTISTGLSTSALDSFHVQFRAKISASDATAEWIYGGLFEVPGYGGDNVAPAAPTGLLAQESTGWVDLGWDDNSESDLASYNVYREVRLPNVSPTTMDNLFINTGSTISSFTDIFATSGDSVYWYAVTALDDYDNESAKSSTSYAQPATDEPPAAPVIANYIAGDAQVYIEWDDNADDNFRYYRVYRYEYIAPGVWSIVGLPGAEPTYLDAGLTNDVEYGYYVTAVDGYPQESAPSDTIWATPTEATDIPVQIDNDALAANYIDASGDSLTVELAITLNKTARVKLYSSYYSNNSTSLDASGQAPSDTSSTYSPYHDWHEVETTGDVAFDTRIPSPTVAADSSITLDWKYTDFTGDSPAAPESLCIERSHNGGAWAPVAYLGSESGTRLAFTHTTNTADYDTVVAGVLRGQEYYRIFGFNGDRDVFTSRAPAFYGNMLDADPSTQQADPWYNQSVQYIFQVAADDGDTTDLSNTFSGIYSGEYVAGADETAPVIASRTVSIDTTARGNVILEMEASSAGSEQALVQWQWAPAYDGTLTPVTALWWSSLDGNADGNPHDGADSTHAYTMTDTIATGYGIASGLGFAQLDSVHIQYRIKDAADNVSDWANVDTVFTRKAEVSAGAWDGTVVISNSSTAYGDSSAVTWVTDDVYAAVMAAKRNDADEYIFDWGDVTSAATAPWAPLGITYGSQSGLYFTPSYSPVSGPFFSFGEYTELEGATINSATLHLKTADITGYTGNFTNMGALDRVKVYSCALDGVLHEWLDATNPNDNISYTNSDVAGPVAWTTTVDQWDTSADNPNQTFGTYVEASPLTLGNGDDVWIQFDVKTLVEEQVTNSAPLMFHLRLVSAASNAFASLHNMGYDNGNGGSAAADRPYLVLDVTAATPSSDTTAPALVSMAAASFDSATASNVEIDVAMVADEKALAWWQFKHLYDGTWNPSTAEWYASKDHTDTTFATSLTDSILSTYATSALDSVYVRVKLKDTSQNVSDWIDPTDDSKAEARKFVRADATAPDTTGLFTSIAYDTTYTDNVRMDLVLSGATAPEDIQAWVQWKNEAGGTWSPDERWRPTVAASSLTDTIYTLESTATLDADTTYSRFKIRDVSLNESDWSDTYKKVFLRNVDLSPPDTASAFVSLAYDTTTWAGYVGVEMKIDAAESVQVWQQWMSGGGSWAPTSPAWQPDNPGTAEKVEFTAWTNTGVTTLGMTGKSTYSRWKIRDLALNESAWQPHDDADGIQMDFVRAAESTVAWTGHIIVGASPTHPLTRSSDYGQVASGDTASGGDSIDQWVTDASWGSAATYCAIIDMTDTGGTSTGADWGFASASATPCSDGTARTETGGWSVSAGGGTYKRRPLLWFAGADSMHGATVDSAKLWIRNENAAFTNMDSVYVWPLTGITDPEQWANDNDDVSFVNADQSATTTWSPVVEDTWARETHGGIPSITPKVDMAGVIEGVWVPDWASSNYGFLPVKTALQDILDNEKPIVFFLTFTSDGAAYMSMNDNGHEDASAAERFYLEVWLSE